MRYASAKFWLITLTCSTFLPAAIAQTGQVSPVSLENQIKLLQGHLCNFRVIDTAVYFIETHLKIKPTYAMNVELISDSLNNPGGDSLTTIVNRLAKCTGLDCVNGASTINVFIKAYTKCLESGVQASNANAELKLDLLYYYHSAWNLFHHAKPGDWDFDENLLAIYHLHRSNIGLRINSRITELRQQIELDSLQTKIDSLVSDMEKSKEIGKIRFDSIDSINNKNKAKLDSLLVKQEHAMLIAPFFRKGKWLQKSQKLSHDTVLSLTRNKTFRKGKKALKKEMRKVV